MACNLTKGRNITCRDGIGGIKAIYIVQHDELTSYVSASGELTDLDLGSGDDIYKYTLKRGTGSVTETINASSENGTVFYTQAVNVKLHDLTKEDQNQVKLLAQQRMVIFAELNAVSSGGKNVIVACGLDNGAELSAGTSVTGVGLGDMSGYDWTFEAQEPNPMQVVADYTTTPFDNGAFTFNAVVTS
tara:strand:- start:6509 stop:7072 length:564 start_codon:yes stop_codon:yes gene_type:complete